MKYILAILGAFSATSSILVLIFFILNPLQLFFGEGPKNEQSKAIAEAVSVLYHDWMFLGYLSILTIVFFVIFFLTIDEIAKQNTELKDTKAKLRRYIAKNL